MVKKLNPIQVREKLVEKDLLFFSPRDFQALFNVSKSATQKFIHQYTKKGLFLKVRNGLYVLKDRIPPYFLLANKTYEPSYISLETALSYYGLIPETVYSVTSITTKPTREFDVLGVSFDYFKIKSSVFCGYRLQRIQDSNYSFLIAEPEKALADYLYFTALDKRSLNERLDVSSLDADRVRGWADMFDQTRMNSLISDLFPKNNS